MKWVKKWHIKSESSNREYVVSLSDENTWGCSCPAWKFRRQECKHIVRVKLNPERYKEIEDQLPKPEYVLAVVDRPTFKEKENKLLIPLIRIEPYDVKMEAIICYTMAKHGYKWKEIAEIRNLSSAWTLTKVKEYYEGIKLNG
jgi:hypothetical protein